MLKEKNKFSGIKEKNKLPGIKKVNLKEMRKHWDAWEQNILNDKSLMAALKALSHK